MYNICSVVFNCGNIGISNIATLWSSRSDGSFDIPSLVNMEVWVLVILVLTRVASVEPFDRADQLMNVSVAKRKGVEITPAEVGCDL